MYETRNYLLNIKKLVKEYEISQGNLFFSKKILRALDNVSLTLKSGESLGIVGESGSGKSTLARTIMGLESIQSGEIFFMGEILNSLKSKNLRRIRKNLQMIFQDPNNSLDPRQTIGKIVSEPLSLVGKISTNEKLEKVSFVLEKVGLSPNDIIKYPHEFSGGQRQRIAIARALITRPALIIADEPVSALDVSVQGQVLNLMMDLRDEHRLAYLFISHDLSIVRQITTKVAVMYAGKIIEMGSTENLFNNPKHPYTNSLLEAIPKLEPLRKIKKRKKFINSNFEKNNLFTKSKTGCSFAFNCPYALEKCKINTPFLENLKKDLSNGMIKNETEKTHEVACYYPLN